MMNISEIADEIARIYENERHGEAVARADQVPPSYDAITIDWLTAILCPDGSDAEVVSFELGERDDGSSNRRRIFVNYNDAGREAGLPATIFCKATDTLGNRVLLGASGVGRAEADFYNKVRDRLDIEAPTACHAGYDPANYASITVLHDLQGKADFCDERTPIDRDLVQSQVDNLAKLHGRFYESPELGTETLPFLRWSEWWKRMIGGMPLYPEFCDRAFEQSEQIMPARLFRRRSEIWGLTEQSVAQHDKLPSTLMHSDVHLKNWYITKDRRMGLSDWQTVTVGHWSRDYIYTITTALTVEDRRAWQDELLRSYLDGLAAAGGARVTWDEAVLNLRQQTFSALAFWTNTLCPPPGVPPMQPERTTIEFLKRLYAVVDDLDACDSFA